MSRLRLSPDDVAAIRSSPETNAELARRYGVSRQCISKVRLGRTHQPGTAREDGRLRDGSQDGRLTTSQLEDAVRAVLARSFQESHVAVAAALGLSRETVRKIRFGLQWADVAPDLERLDPANLGALCYRCVHWSAAGDGSCTLGIPEAVTDGHLHARGCGAYLRAR